MTIMLQPDTGNPIAPLPYPFHVADDGSIGRQDHWKGDPAVVIGFVANSNRQEIDLPWTTYVADEDWDQAVGLYVVVADRDGNFSTFLTPIGRVHVS